MSEKQLPLYNHMATSVLDIAHCKEVDFPYLDNHSDFAYPYERVFKGLYRLDIRWKPANQKIKKCMKIGAHAHLGAKEFDIIFDELDAKQ